MNTFSIITVVYNDLTNLKMSIESIKAQDFSDFEHIIIDGCSTDGTPNYLSNLKTSYPLKFKSEKDKGIYDGMNKGILLASGKYLYFLNAGDTLYSSRTLSDVSKNLNNAGLLFGKVICRKEGIKYIKGEKTELKDFTFGLPVPHQGFFYRKDLLKQYDINYSLIADFILTRDLVKRTPVVFLDLIICTYDLSGVSSVNHFKEYREKIRFLFNEHEFRNLLLYAPKYLIKYTIIRALKNLGLYEKIIQKIKKNI